MFNKVSGSICLKRGAMFGLDARIALAIFGALSVISGAALYSAIKQARTTAYYQETREIAKAMEALFIDTGVLELTDQIKDLLEDPGVDGWNGPYIQDYVTLGSSAIGKTGSNTFLQWFYAYKKSDEDWPADLNSWGPGCGSGDRCYYYLRRGIPLSDPDNLEKLESLFKDLDEKYDNNDGETKGKIRLLKPAGNGSFLYIRLVMTKN